jgi:hypothetical protein
LVAQQQRWEFPTADMGINTVRIFQDENKNKSGEEKWAIKVAPDF